MAKKQPKPLRISLTPNLGNRAANLSKDGRMLNAIAEPDVSVVRAMKRSGMTSRYTLTTGQASATIGQLLFAFQTPSAPGIAGTSTLIGIRGDAITRPVT